MERDRAAVTGIGIQAYAYRALMADGSTRRGVIEAETSARASDRLREAGGLPLELRQTASHEEPRASLSTEDLAIGLRILADLLGSGMPVRRALEAFTELAPKGWAPALPSIQRSVREGQSLSHALAGAPVAIPALVLGIAAAGEAGAGIGPAIRHAAELTETMASTRAAVRAALAYPAVLAIAGIASIGVMITVVLPRFAIILSDLGQTLPASTRLVLRAATLAKSLWWPFLLLAFLSVVVMAQTLRHERGRRAIHRWLLSVPVIGTLRFASASARVARTLATLMRSGVPIRRAVAFAAAASGDAEVRWRTNAALEGVQHGRSLATALASTQAVTPLVIRMARAGESSGHLADMLDHAGHLEHERSDRLMRTAVRFLEPALILTFAGIVGYVAAALLQAVYSIRPT